MCVPQSNPNPRMHMRILTWHRAFACALAPYGYTCTGDNQPNYAPKLMNKSIEDRPSCIDIDTILVPDTGTGTNLVDLSIRIQCP